MKQLLILSGKGGTGKTTVAAAFIRLASARAYADCDVDAPNLHLIVNHPPILERMDFYGLSKARIDPDRCTLCGKCIRHCRFEAIADTPVYAVNPFVCEGCGVCAAVCPANAITLLPAVAGDLMQYSGGGSVFSTARLRMGSGTSGKLVTEVKRQLTTAAGDAELAIVDGSPGIGCPVIASLSGADMVLVVAEPSLSGFSDMVRILRTSAVFNVKTAVCINKHDVNAAIADEIEAFCTKNGISFAGRIPFDTQAATAINSGMTIADIDCPSGRAVKEVFRLVEGLLHIDHRGEEIDHHDAH
jgi:MinD superfamily P-loop ATPase